LISVLTHKSEFPFVSARFLLRFQINSNILIQFAVNFIFMTMKSWMVIAFVALLGGLSLYLNKDWFARSNIQIIHLSGRGQRAPEGAVAPIVFGFKHKLKLTSIEVVPVKELSHPIWHLVSESNSVPTEGFTYGQHIHGMHSKIRGAEADPLEPGIQYRLLVQAGSLKGEHDFTPEAQQ
jgi:hypothetical protein